MAHEGFGTAAKLLEALQDTRISVGGYLEAVRHLMIEAGASEAAAQRTARESLRTARGSSNFEASFVFEGGNVEGGGVPVAPSDRPGVTPPGQRDLSAPPPPGPFDSETARLRQVEASESFRGRQDLFGGFTANQFGQLPSRVRPAVQAQFNPLQAQFGLSGLLDGSPGSRNFRGFLGSGATPLGRDEFSALLDQIGGAFNPNQIDPEAQTRLEAFVAQGFVNPVIRQSFGSQGGSGFRNILSNVINQRLDRFRDVNPSFTQADLFRAFLDDRRLQGAGFFPQ